MSDEWFCASGRRHFLISATSLIGAAATRMAWAGGRPCAPPTLSVDGGTSAQTPCDPDQLPVLTLTSAAASGTYPWTFGQAFKKGDVPSGSYINGNANSFQADIRNRWTDGSVKYAVLSGISSFTNGVPNQVAITTSTTAPSNSNVPEPTNLDVSVSFSGDLSGTYTLQSCLGTDLSSWNVTKPGRIRQMLGPVMSEFHYYRPTSDAHLAVWFYVRCYSNGSTEVETVVENGWLNIDAPGQKDYNVVVEVGGSTRFSGSLSQFHHTRWSRVDWIGPAPQITPKHDVAYLRDTKLVPNYGYTSPSNAALSSFDASQLNPAPFARGDWSVSMGNTGYQDAIGLLPKWEALYCTSGDAKVYVATISNNRNSGRWPIHFRDEITGRVPLYTSYPNMTIASGWGTPLPKPSGGSDGPWDIAHHPSNGFLAYLIEGRWPALESLQFAAWFAIQDANPSTRQNGGVLSCENSPLTTRGVAWAWRTMAQAAAISPTTLASNPSHPADAALQAAFAASIDDTAEWHRQRYVDGTIHGGKFKNAIGWLGQYDRYSSSSYPSTEWWGGSWMVQFQSMSLGYASDLEIEGLASPSNLAAMRDHSYDNCLLQLGDDSTWNFRRGGVYSRPYLKNSSNPSSPVFMTPAEAFSSYKAASSLVSLSANAGDSLKAHDSENDEGGGSSNDANGYWALALAALAYAVDHGKTGASSKFVLVTSASNYDPAAHGANDDPTWAIVPR